MQNKPLKTAIPNDVSRFIMYISIKYSYITQS